MTSLNDIWPLFSLRLLTPRLEMRPLRDEDIARYVDAALSGVHPRNQMPFSVPWTDAPADELGRNTAEHVWRTRLESRPEAWALALGIWFEGELVGCQDVSAKNFALLRTVSTGSWLQQSMQGRGLGREMRAAVALYAFDYLGAEVAESEAAAWNAASLGVSASVGYLPNGVRRAEARPGEMMDMQRVRLIPDSFHRPEWTLTVQGHDGVARFLELPPHPATLQSLPAVPSPAPQ